jgi:hypothetical protein
MYVFVCISASAGGNSQDHYTFHFLCILYKLCKCGFDRSITKSTLLGEQSMFLSVSRLSSSGNSLVRYTMCFRIIRYKHRKFGCDLSLMEGTLLEEEISTLHDVLI